MSGNKSASQFMTHFINKTLKVLFTLLTKFVLHFLGATCVSLRTYPEVFTCKSDRKHCFNILTKDETREMYWTILNKNNQQNSFHSTINVFLILG